jgi:hypothetical protein
MKGVRFIQAFVGLVPRASVRIAGSIGLAALTMTAGAMAQDANSSANPPAAPNQTVKDGYIVHQSFDLGGHVASTYGSGSMYDTMVNMASGPRVLNQTMELHSAPGAKRQLFDTLFEDSTGYGGDPHSFTTLRASKGKLYDFVGTFRRDRQYFDYNLLGNPLIPANDTVTVGTGASAYSYTYPQVENATHLFNTVRRMTDVTLTMLPLSKISFRVGYSQNIMQGPSYSSIHLAGEGLLLQNWRNSTDTFLGGVDWKPIARTVFTYEEHVTHYKGNTSWTLAPLGLNAQLASGTPVSLGFDSAPAASCYSTTSGLTNPPTTTGKCAGYISYSRDEPTRTLFPTEEFRFESSTIRNIQITGRVLYTEANMNMPSYYEYMNGLQTRSPNPSIPAGGYALTSTITGNGIAKRIDTAADYGIVWQISPQFSVAEQYDFLNFHQPAAGYLSESDEYGPELMGAAPTGTTSSPVVTSANNSLGQKTESNAVTGAWDATAWIQVSLGYRYRGRTLHVLDSATGFNYAYADHRNSTLLNVAMRLDARWKINSSVETGWSDNAYVQISPRQFQQYQIRATYRPKEWATLSGSFNDLERRNNAYLVEFMAHNRSLSGGASLTPNEHYSVDLNYGYLDTFSRSTNCFGDPAGSQPADAIQMPAGATCGNLPSGTTLAWYGTSYYDSPTQYGSADVVLTPVKRFQSVIGYRINSIQGNTEMLNPLDALGTLQSKYQSPYAKVAWKLTPAWAFKANWNYYGYGEEEAAGPTAPRNFHGNVYTLGVHYEY